MKKKGAVYTSRFLPLFYTKDGTLCVYGLQFSHNNTLLRSLSRVHRGLLRLFSQCTVPYCMDRTQSPTDRHLACCCSPGQSPKSKTAESSKRVRVLPNTEFYHFAF